MSNKVTSKLDDKRLKNAFENVFLKNSLATTTFAKIDDNSSDEDMRAINQASSLKSKLGTFFLSVAEPSLLDTKSVIVAVLFSLSFTDLSFMSWLLLATLAWFATCVVSFYASISLKPISHSLSLKEKYAKYIAPSNYSDEEVSGMSFMNLSGRFMESNVKNFHMSIAILVPLLAISVFSMHTLVLFLIPLFFFKVVSYGLLSLSAACLNENHDVIMLRYKDFFQDVLHGAYVRTKKTAIVLNADYGKRYKQ